MYWGFLAPPKGDIARASMSAGKAVAPKRLANFSTRSDELWRRKTTLSVEEKQH
jgi:hypothetical protein